MGAEGAPEGTLDEGGGCRFLGDVDCTGAALGFAESATKSLSMAEALVEQTTEGGGREGEGGEGVEPPLVHGRGEGVPGVAECPLLCQLAMWAYSSASSLRGLTSSMRVGEVCADGSLSERSTPEGRRPRVR